jgi:ribonuclease E
MAMAQGTDASAGTTDAEGAEPREKRSRDRYGRDRGRGGERNGRGNRGEDRNVAASTDDQAQQAQPVQPTLDGFATAAAPVADVAAPAQTVAAPAAAVAPAPAAVADAPAAGLPRVPSFELPVDALAQMAQASGLSWVNSDEEKIKLAQAAIAAQPEPIHVPREIPVREAVDEGPLVLVETKRDLRNMSLPFEQSSAS